MQADEAARLLGAELRHVVFATDRMRSAIASRLHLGTTELTALAHLVEAGELTPKELAGRLGITPGSVTGVADRLVEAGLLARVPHPSDRRSLLLRPTPTGIRQREWANGQWEAVLGQTLDDRLAALAPEMSGWLAQAADLILGAALDADHVAAEESPDDATRRCPPKE